MEKVWNTCGVTIKLKKSHEFIALKQWVNKLGSSVFFSELQIAFYHCVKKIRRLFWHNPQRLQNKMWTALKFSPKT